MSLYIPCLAECLLNKPLLIKYINLAALPIRKLASKKFMLVLNKLLRASQVAQWLRVCLPMQGTRVQALVWDDPTCRGAAGPVSSNY